MKLPMNLNACKRFIHSTSRVLGVALMIAVLLNSPAVFAQITTDDVKSIKNGTPWYDPNECVAGSTAAAPADGGPTNLVGSDNVQKAYNFFVSKGLTPIQSAGIVGNLRGESQVNPASDNPAATSGGGGIAQWEGGRWSGPSGLLAYVAGTKDFEGKGKQGGGNWKDLTAQLNFLWGELTGIFPNNKQPGLERLKKATNITEATNAILEDFERPRDPNQSRAKRIKYAQQVLTLYGGTNPPAPGETPATGDTTAAPGCEAEGEDGTAGVATNGDFIVYNQCDPAWANKPYGSSRICPSGCGPSAMAMVITALKKERVTPDMTSKYAGEKGMYIPGTGSSWDVPKVVAPHWGLKATFIGKDQAKIEATLRAGGMVVTPGRGAKPFTQGGHYIAIRGITEDGKWLVGDSGHRDTSAKKWNPQSILVNMSGGGVYAITK